LVLPTRTFALVLAVLLVAVCAPRAAAPRPAPPRLAVILMVDQMRADSVDQFKDDWSAGLKRLVTKGAWCRRGANPIDADYGKTWSRLLPDSQYQGPDDGLGEAPPPPFR
jgi:hypothetical protein